MFRTNKDIICPGYILTDLKILMFHNIDLVLPDPANVINLKSVTSN